MGSHSVTCHPTQVNAPHLTGGRKDGTQFTYTTVMEGRVDLGMLYLSADSHPFKYYLGLVHSNLLTAANVLLF